MQYNNQFGVAAECRIIACILHNVKLITVHLGHEPSDCIGHDAWKSEGLPVPPSEVVAQDWWRADSKALLRFLRVRRVFVCNLKLLRTQLTPSPRPALSSTTA